MRALRAACSEAAACEGTLKMVNDRNVPFNSHLNFFRWGGHSGCSRRSRHSTEHVHHVRMAGLQALGQHNQC